MAKFSKDQLEIIIANLICRLHSGGMEPEEELLVARCLVTALEKYHNL